MVQQNPAGDNVSSHRCYVGHFAYLERKPECEGAEETGKQGKGRSDVSFDL